MYLNNWGKIIHEKIAKGEKKRSHILQHINVNIHSTCCLILFSSKKKKLKLSFKNITHRKPSIYNLP